VFCLFCSAGLVFCFVSLAFLHLITGRCCCSCQPQCLFTVHVGSESSLSLVEFSSLRQSHKLSRSWFLGARPAPARASPARPAHLFTAREVFPSPNLQCSVCPTLYPVCLYCSYCLLLSLPFFPGWRSVCPGGYADLSQGCLWEYHGTAKLTLSMSSQAIWVRAPGSPGALLVSPLT
jgi:hypothetical protein